MEGGRQEMLLPLKREIDSYYVFPKVAVINGQPCILWDTGISGHTLDAQLRLISEILGLLNHFFSYQFRYGGGELLNHTGLRYIQGVSDTGELCQYGYNHAFDDSSAVQPSTAHGRSQALRPRH